MTTLTYSECDELLYILSHPESLKSCAYFTLQCSVATALDRLGLDEEGV